MDVLNTHLPKILDLAKNFNLDLSGVLAGYAQKLHDDVPELMENFSFPEAALLLQHCAEIYGRKVDYVHTLALELCENMNSRMYAPESAQGQGAAEPASLSPKKLANARKKKTVSIISTEDFKMNSFSLEKPNTFHRGRKKKKKKHCAEAVCVRLAAVNLPSHEFHIYDDDAFASIGTKDQFRLNWPIEQNCRLEEYILDEGSGNLWNVCDVGVSNMPTPEYSDDGARCPSPRSLLTSPGSNMNVDCGQTPDCSQISDSNEIADSEIPDSNDIPDCNKFLDSSQTNCDIAEVTTVQELHKSGAPSKENLVDNTTKDQAKEKSKSAKTTFKLPYELTKKGLKEAKPEGNITLFLFSDLLKRSLGIKGPLPPVSKNKNADNKLIEKHIDFLKKKYKLGTKSLDTGSLLEEQTDFLGFDEEPLPDIPDVLMPIGQSSEHGKTVKSSKSKVADRIVDFEDYGHHDDNWDADNTPHDNTSHDNTSFQEDTQSRRPTIDEQGVRNWRQFIQGKLAAEEEQKPFDVHSYGSDIINAFHHVGETLPFEAIVGGMDVREIGRYFVSSLMLANTTNLNIEDSGKPNTLRMTLQKTERFHDMEDILVPPSVGGLEKQSPQKQSQAKRKSQSNLEEEEESTQHRYLKQIPGKGPWRNKSKKGREFD